VTNWAVITGGGRDCGGRDTVCLGNLRGCRYKHRRQDDFKVELVEQGDRFWGGLICLNIGTSDWLL
jgi:hypothetical protein